MYLFQQHRNKILISLLLAIAVYAALFLISDIRQLSVALAAFHWEFLPFILALTCLNYALRFVKWHFYLKLVGAQGLPWTESLLIFLSGFSMTLTPGKAGEWLKSLLVRERIGTPIAVTAPIVLAERMTDGLAMLLLAGAGLFLFDSPAVRIFMGLLVLIAAIVVALIRNRQLARRFAQWLEQFPILEARLHHLRAFYKSSYELLRLRYLAFAVVLGFISWSGECVALALVLFGLGIPLSWTLVVLSAFAMGFSTLAGSLLLTPGGLGIAEGSIDGLLLAFGRSPWLGTGVTINQPTSAAATLMIRFATLWFGVTLGFISLAIVQRRTRDALASTRASQIRSLD